MAVSDGLLQLDPLLASARAKAGLDDFVDEEFIEPLTHLLAAYRSEADFSAQGAQAMHGHLVDALVTRLRIHHCVKLHPEILQEEIRGPLVILGLPRTGTTKLQRLLGSSPHMQKLPFWKLLTPVPLDDVSSNASDPRIALAEQFVAGMKQAFPRFYAGHPVIATEPDEEDFLLELSFKGSPAYWMARIPTYQAWTRSQSIESTYRWLKTILQLVQWHEAPGVREQRWLLKAPSHIGHLDDFFAVFPQTTIIHCHRDPVELIASAAAIAEAMRCFYSDRVDKKTDGRFVMELLSAEITDYLRTRKKWEAAGRTFIDVRFADVVGNVDAVVEGICRQTGISFSAETRSALARWEADNPRHKHGRFEYTLEEYGLTAAEIREKFAEYSDCFLHR